ncbi:MAG: rhamnan synthesis F family protein [Clostridiales Family XIII bacterium]|jgi:rhamnosyltransferase|nr:rhamnan synthesis F family protein [Clostridiales Family XIII bacterium]
MRAAIFVFYDKDGIADDYVICYLAKLAEVAERIVIVSNGSVRPETRERFDPYIATGDLVVRENKGFDAWAYKAGLAHIGPPALAECDEVIIANDTVFGPVYPFASIFAEMGERPELDFWGITQHPASQREDLFARNNPYGYTPAHLQTYFVVFRKALVGSEAFARFWDKLQAIEKYEEAVGKFESLMTKLFADAGFAWDSFIHTDDIATDNPNLTMFCPETMLKDRRFPFLKCRVFRQDMLTFNAGDQVPGALDYIRAHTDYDVDLIWQSILRKLHMCDFVKSLALTYVLPRDSALPGPALSGRRAPRVALFMHIYYPEFAHGAAALAANMPDGAHIYITTDSEEKARAIRAIFKETRSATGFVIVENRGRSESALLVGMAKTAAKYDVACFWKEKASKQVDYHAALGWAHKIDDALLSSKDYTENVVRTFAKEPRLGLLCVPEPMHAVYHWVPGHEWSVNFENTKELAEKLGLKAPMDPDAQPVCSFGGAFWFRPAALQKLFAHPWAYGDFPEEPLPTDASLLHAIERIYPFVAQDAGYYPAFVMSDHYASLEYTNVRHCLAAYTYSALYAGHGFDNYMQAADYVVALGRHPILTRIRQIAKRRLSRGPYVLLRDAKRVLIGPDRRAALREIHLRVFRKMYIKRLEKQPK